MRTGSVPYYPASEKLPEETAAIHVWGETSLPAFHLPLSSESLREELGEVVWKLQPMLGISRSALRELFEKLADFSYCGCGSVFTSGGDTDRRFHVSILVPAGCVLKAKELALGIGAYLEG